MSNAKSWPQLQQAIVSCRRCPRLRQYCTHVAATKRASFHAWTYWGKPVPNLGDPHGRILIVGLAPAAHGANRTGRMFTGDRSGDFLFRALFETGFANQPTSTDKDDGLVLTDLLITAAVHCAPPDNKPTLHEQANCAHFLDETVARMPRFRGVVALGKIGFDATVAFYRRQGWIADRSARKFSHGVVLREAGKFILGTYHPSQQNTFTGRLTPEMMRAIFEQARGLAAEG